MSAYPSTPPIPEGPRPSLTPSDDSSILEELSFAYEVDSNGKAVRVAHDSAHSNQSNNIFPPTPPDAHFSAQTEGKSPTLLGRGLVARGDGFSRSAAQVATSDSNEGHTFTSAPSSSRSLQRVASGPAGSNAVHRPGRVPRVTLEKHEESAEEYRMRQLSATDAPTNGRWSPPPPLPTTTPSNRYGSRPASVAGYGSMPAPRRSPQEIKPIPRRAERVAREPGHWGANAQSLEAGSAATDNDEYDTDNGEFI